MRIACAFDETTWHFFLGSELDKLLKLLLAADEVISFNGLQFDELVLRKHCKLKGKLPSKGLHVDLCHEISLTHHSVSLHRLSLLNLNEGKHTAGRSMAALDVEALKLACKSDVWQTYRLWDLWRKETINVPAPRAIKDDEDFVGPGHHMPALCPSCHSANSLELIDEDPEDMSEGKHPTTWPGCLAAPFAALAGQRLIGKCNARQGFLALLSRLKRIGELPPRTGLNRT
jgi:hypothetical protein